uniref:EF-hand domain-containing protein n=1 Tax=Branchiostoma floridae TaxID=7739 RepID=C3Y347_BRAFL|eukprot:XP_002609449.1 hypothetical protein BRAFLDRAFT_127026 [Branchiostoma floridae]
MELPFCTCLLLLWQLSVTTCHVHIHPNHYPDHYVDGEHDAEFDREILLGGKKEAEEYQKLSPEESKQRLMLLVKKIDVNGDGLLDRAYSSEEEWRIVEREQFDEYDKDGDGVLEGEEVAAWVTPNHREAAEEEADHLLSMADTNKDEKLSAEEIMSDPDLFLQSDLTEQGELLHTIDHQEL